MHGQLEECEEKKKMSGMTGKQKVISVYLFSFLAPVFLMMAIYASLGIGYHGKLTVLSFDLKAQYAPFIAGLRYLLKDPGSILFNWNNSLGGNYLLIKPNENEIRTLFDDFSSPLSSLAEKLHKKGAENVLITKGGEGAYFFSRDKEYEIKVPKVEVVSTIGSGDSTLAGFTYALSLSLLLDTLMSALAFGTNNAMHREVGKVEIKEVEEIRKKIEIKEVNNYDL